LIENEVLAMLDKIKVSSLVNSIVPISRFNRGEASKIFEEVSSDGYKVVVKNNKPSCILMSPKKIRELQ
jgi:PHD/YefM family antitoxin component YafN of YafNO toxin-antitoxin module